MHFQIERPGKDLVGRWYDEVGDLFKSQGYTGDEGPWSWGDARLIRGTRNRFSESERYEYTFNRKTLGWKNQPEDGKPDMVEPMIEALHAARGSRATSLTPMAFRELRRRSNPALHMHDQLRGYF